MKTIVIITLLLSNTLFGQSIIQDSHNNNEKIIGLLEEIVEKQKQLESKIAKIEAKLNIVDTVNYKIAFLGDNNYTQFLKIENNLYPQTTNIENNSTSEKKEYTQANVIYTPSIQEEFRRYEANKAIWKDGTNLFLGLIFGSKK